MATLQQVELRARPLRKLLFGITYCLGLLIFMEMTLRGLMLSDTFFDRVILGQSNDDAAWRLRFILGQDKKEPIVNYTVHHPTRGWAVRPGIDRLAVFNNKTLNSNSRGLRGSADYPYGKASGILRILTLGDSFTFGAEVSDDETWPYYLEKYLPRSEVLNFGVHGYGHDQMLLYLREEGLKYRPDIVVLGFLSMDMGRNVLSFRDYAKPRFVVDDGQLALTNVPILPVDETLAREPWRSKLLDALSMLRTGFRDRLGPLRTETEQITIALLDEIATVTRTAGAVPLFVYLPFEEIARWRAASGTATSEIGMSDDERFFFSYCSERGIQAIDLKRFFIERLQSGLDLKRTTFHYRSDEHRIVAEGIRAYLIENGFARLSDKTARTQTNTR